MQLLRIGQFTEKAIKIEEKLNLKRIFEDNLNMLYDEHLLLLKQTPKA